MKAIPFVFLTGLLVWAAAGCESDSGDSESTVTTVTTNTVTGEVQTNVVAVEEADEVADAAVGDAEEALGDPLAAPTVDGKWIGTYEDGVQTFLLSLSLVQDGSNVSGTYAFSDAGSGTIDSGVLSGSTLNLSVKRAGIICSITGQVDFDAATIRGEWADKAGNEGTFFLR